MEKTLKRLGFVILTLAMVLLVGTVGYHYIADYPWFEAFYMTVITVTTVGYREVLPLNRAGQWFTVFVLFSGVSALFFLIGVMTSAVVEQQFGEYFGRRRAKRMIGKIQGHVIVCGYGRVGRAAVDELRREKRPFVVVDRNPDKVEAAVRAGALAVVADATRDEVLREVGIERARGLVTALSTDADNLFVILSAKAINPQLRVATRVAEEDSEGKLLRAGADVVFAPYLATGRRLAQALVRPHVTQFLDVATTNLGLDVQIEQVRVGEGSQAQAKSLRDLQLRRDVGVIVLAIRRATGEMVFNPPAEAALSGGDFLIAMGPADGLRKLEQLVEPNK